jgi:putative nucleotidyltransferase-like protein
VLPPVADWDALLAIAEDDGVAPGLAYVVGATPAGVPLAVRDRLTRVFAAATGCHVLFSRELARVLAAFAAEGVTVIALKGAVLAETLYPHPALRPFHDLDLLVRPEDLTRADARLRALGYARTADEHGWRFDVAWDRATLYEAPGGVRVDLHWGLLNDPRFRWRDADAAGVWDRAVDVRLAGVATRALAAEDLLLHLAVHLAVHHAGEGLLWQWDLARLVERGVDWDVVTARAARWRVGRALAFALAGVARRFDVAVPAAALPRPGRRSLRGLLARRVAGRAAGDPRARADYLLPLLLADRGRDAARALGRALCPAPAWVRARYADRARSLPGAYAAHAGRLLHLLRVAVGPAPVRRRRPAAPPSRSAVAN